MFDNIVCSINNRLKKILTKLNAIGTDVTSVQTTSSEIKSLIANNSSSVIKSIQRGVIKSESSGEHTVAINEVNIEKTFVCLNGYEGYGRDPDYTYIKALTSNSLTIYVSTGYKVYTSYHVVEFY